MKAKFLTFLALCGVAINAFAAWSQRDYDSFDDAVSKTQASYHSSDAALQLPISTKLANTASNATYVSHTWTSGSKAGQTENLVKVLTWTWNYSTWTQPKGSEWALNNPVGGGYAIFPWVTLGGSDDNSTLGDMQSYFRNNYASLATEEQVYDKIWHSLGMKESTNGTYERVLVEILVSVDDLIRPSFFYDTEKTPDSSDFPKDSSGAYIANSVAGLENPIRLQSAINYATTLVSDENPYSMQNWLDSNTEVEDIKNSYPFTAMGYTYNTDPDLENFIGLSEFCINGDAVIVNYNVIGAGELYAYLIPEPSTYAIIFGALVLVFALYRKRK